jgi:hypothetical protein
VNARQLSKNCHTATWFAVVTKLRLQNLRILFRVVSHRPVRSAYERMRKTMKGIDSWLSAKPIGLPS